MFIRTAIVSAVIFAGHSSTFAVDQSTTPAHSEIERYGSLLEHEDAGKRATAARILGSIGDPRAIPALRKATYDKNPRVRWDAAFAIAAISGDTGVPSSAAQKPRKRRQIVFPLLRNGHLRIYTIFSDGTGFERLLHGYADYEAALSANGRTLVSCCYGSSQRAIQVRDMKSARGRTLAAVPLGIGLSGPKISDDGSLVLFRRDNQIFVTRSDATKHVFVSRKSQSAGFYADLSGDGRKIAFDSAGELFVADANGSNLQRFTTNGSQIKDISPALSRDGKRLAWMSGNYPDWEIWVANIDGTGKRNVSRNKAVDSWPAISPDGTQVAFDSDRAGDREIYTVGFDGKRLVQLTDSEFQCIQPRFSADGTMIFFETAHRYDVKDLCVMNVDGRGLRILVRDLYGPKWRDEGIDFVIQPEKPTVRAGKDVTIKFRLKNRTHAAIRLGSRIEVKLFLPDLAVVDAGGRTVANAKLPEQKGGTFSLKSGNEIQFSVSYPWKRVFPLMAKHQLSKGSVRLTAEISLSDPFRRSFPKSFSGRRTKRRASDPRFLLGFPRSISAQPIIVRSRR